MGLTRQDLDIVSGDLDAALKQYRPDVLINCAAYTNVDACETNPEAFLVNGTGPAMLALACKALGVKLLQLSTDMVSDGGVNSYGMGKFSAENSVRRHLSAGSRIILRTSWVTSPTGGWLPAIMKLPPQQCVNRISCPTLLENLASAIINLTTDPDAWQDDDPIWHFCNRGEVGRADLFNAALAAAGNKHRVQIVDKDERPGAAPRAMRSVLDCSRYEARYGRIAHWGWDFTRICLQAERTRKLRLAGSLNPVDC